MGPLVSQEHMNKVLNAVEEARKGGATIHTHGGVLGQEYSKLSNEVRVNYFPSSFCLQTNSLLQVKVFDLSQNVQSWCVIFI